MLSERTGKFGVPHPRGIAHASEQPLRPVHAKSLNQLLAQRALRLGMDQQHAVFVQPDLTSVRAKMDLFVKVFAGRIADGPSNAASFGHVYSSQGYLVSLLNPSFWQWSQRATSPVGWSLGRPPNPVTWGAS